MEQRSNQSPQSKGEMACFLLTVLAFVLSVVVSVIPIRLAGKTYGELLLIWFWFGAFAIPQEGFKKEWQYWVATPMGGMGRLINRLINPYRGQFVVRF